MKFKLDNILATFGNIKAMERTHVDDFTENIIKDIDMIPFAISEENVMYANTMELGGYYFFKTIIVGRFNIKTNKGATLKLVGKNLNQELNSDTLEFESEHSNVSNRSITQIDFQLEKEDVSKIKKAKIETITLKTKKTSLDFSIITN